MQPRTFTAPLVGCVENRLDYIDFSVGFMRWNSSVLDRKKNENSHEKQRAKPQLKLFACRQQTFREYRVFSNFPKYFLSLDSLCSTFSGQDFIPIYFIGVSLHFEKHETFSLLFMATKNIVMMKCDRITSAFSHWKMESFLFFGFRTWRFAAYIRDDKPWHLLWEFISIMQSN